MTVLVDLVGDLSWALKAAWIAWATWVGIQAVWYRRARVVVSTREVEARDRVGDRATLGIAVRQERMLASAPPPAPALLVSPPSIPEPPSPPLEAVLAIGDTVEPLAAPQAEPAEMPKGPKRRRRSPRPETASAMST